MTTKKVINIITLGDVGVGKTSIINRIKNKSFDENVSTTISCNNIFIEREYRKKNITICLNFIDTAGQEIYQSLLPKNYIRNSHIVLLVFSDIDSFNTLKNRWYEFYKENSNIDNSKFILIGNKSDEFGDQREQITKYGNEFSQDIDALFVKCSAKNADGIDNLENFIITEARRFIDEEEKKINDAKINNNQKEESQSFRLKKKKKKDKKIWNCLCNK